MSKFHDDSSYATLPGEMSLDMEKLAVFKRELSFMTRLLRRWPLPDELLAEHLEVGCCNPAVVVQIDPNLVIAAFSGDHDWVLLLNFSHQFVQKYSLKLQTRLLTVNTYGRGSQLVCDLNNGPESTHRWTNFFPMIAEFCSSDYDVIEKKKQEVEEHEWQRAAKVGFLLLADRRIFPRNGNPYFSATPQPLRYV